MLSGRGDTVRFFSHLSGSFPNQKDVLCLFFPPWCFVSGRCVLLLLRATQSIYCLQQGGGGVARWLALGVCSVHPQTFLFFCLWLFLFKAFTCLQTVTHCWTLRSPFVQLFSISIVMPCGDHCLLCSSPSTNWD